MSENTPPNAGRPGTEPSSPSPSVSSDSPGAAPTTPAAPVSTAPMPESVDTSRPPPGYDSSAAVKRSTEAPPDPPGASAAALASDSTDPPSAASRASSDTLESASAVESTVGTPPATTHEEDAAHAQSSAAADTAVQEHAAQSADAATAQGATRAPGAPPPGFGAPPDFDTPRPPPASTVIQTQPAYLRHNDSAWSVLGRTIAARARQLFDRAGQRITQRTLRIGVSARIFHPEPGARGLRGKTLQYLEESVAHWVMSRDVMVFMIPTVGHQGMLHPSNIRLRDYAKHLDGLLLQGGADVSPQTYAASDMRPEWPGDRVRDMYELELLYEFIESGKPVLGVCRGCQLINVAFGGTLYQDIATEVPTAGVHVSEFYDQHRHSVRFPDGSTLASMFPGRREALVNSIHHQAVKTLGRDLNIEAVSAGDGLIEAIRYRRAPFVVGVQWHPEFHRAGGPELLDCTPILDTFLRAARETRF
ncbi:type 1 glutamine amidotransferase [Trinickia dinghuensis]|uniref:Peptidase C26 n=1 Tax=Trinickia dinghuensis TaxID=2291023 RepID=A0A3D8JT80_9BURK|nr:type 1 glutamine amidotransferase [Trinickia dinghuensis]RDU95754.1 peptidase C26 [Trinickia dinghuensis]